MATYQIDFVKDNYAFLIGNGINYAMGKGNCSWEKVLYNLADKKLQQQLFYKNAGRINLNLSAIETLNAIQIRSEDDDDMNKKIATEIQKMKFHKVVKSSLLDFVKQYNIDILTTNFDLNIEDYIWDDEYGNKEIKPGGYYPWQKFNKAPKKYRKESKTKIWHIHGSIEKYRSILFSTTRYMRAAGRAVKILNDKNNNYENLRKTWIWQFLSRPLVVAGFGCSSEETFLRWLFIERLMCKKKVELANLPPSYYLYRKCDDIKGIRKFLEFVEITPVCIGDEIFNNSIWRSSDSANISLREVKR